MTRPSDSIRPGNVLVLKNGQKATVIRQHNPETGYSYATINEDGDVNTRWYEHLSTLLLVFHGKVKEII